MAYKISSSTFSISSPVVIKNGTEGYGKILTTDASGLVVWKEPNSFFGTSRYIGELYGGGIVVDFWKEGDVENTLIMSLTHLSYDYVWSNVGSISTNTMDYEWSYSSGAFSLYDGRINSDRIISQQVYNYSIHLNSPLLASHTMSAAKLCEDYNYGGYDDWYLPSYNEFSSIVKNRQIINKVLGDGDGIRNQNIGSGAELAGLYWTSTEYNENTAIPVGGGAYFLNSTSYGLQYSTSEGKFKSMGKTSSAMVRAVRREENLTGNGLVFSLDAGNKNSYDDSNRGNIWYDLVNKGLTSSAAITLPTSVTYSATYSGYFSFNSGSSNLEIDTNLDNSSVVTVEMFARLKSSSSSCALFHWLGNINTSYSVQKLNNYIGFSTNNGEIYGILQATTDYKLIDNWAHYVFVMRSDVSYTSNKIYINGDFVNLGSSTGAENPTYRNFGSGHIRIGNFSTSPFMDLGVFNVYKRELNQTEIVNNFNKYKKRFEVKEQVYQKNLILNLNSNDINSFNPSNLSVWNDTKISSDTRTLRPVTFASTPTYTKSPGVYPGTYINFSNNRASVSTTIAFTHSTTWETWVKFDSIIPSINNMIMGQTLPYFGVSGNNFDKLIFSNSYSGAAGGSNQTYHNSNSSVVINKWYHIVFTTKYDPVSNTTSSKIYIDGKPDYSNLITTNYAGEYNSDSIPGFQNNIFPSTRFAVGDGRNTNWQPFNGSLSEVRIYNRTLNASEIKNNYNSSKHLYDIDQNHYTHNFNTSPTFSVFQNLVLDFPNKQNNSILVSNSRGLVSLSTPSTILPDKLNKKSVGELYAGGIIVSVIDYLTATYYLIASLYDLPSTYYWSTLAGSYSFPYGSNGIGYLNTDIEFSGSSNTTSIIATMSTGVYAAQVAATYSYGGYNDWYLPSDQELAEVSNNIGIINLTLGKNSFVDTYWSSSPSGYARRIIPFPEFFPFAYAYNFGSVNSSIGDYYNATTPGLGLDGATSSGLYINVEKYTKLKVRPFRTQIDSNNPNLIMVIKTNNPGSSPANVINIPTNPLLSTSLYNYDVDWGDGTKSTGLATSTNKTYATAGTYTIKISGRFPSIYYANTGDRLKILEIKNWGSIKWSTMEGAFYGCSNLIITALDSPDLSLVTNMDSMLRDCVSLNQSINQWNVSNVTNMSSLFFGCTIFNKPLNLWNTSKVTNMNYMFYNAIAFNNGGISTMAWNTQNVQNMQSLFFGATNFNADITSWNTSSVTNMSFMFYNANAFNKNIGSWNISLVTDFSSFMATKTPLTLSTTNLNGIYIGWASRPVNPNLFITFGTAKRTAASTTARSILAAGNNWNITDGGI